MAILIVIFLPLLLFYTIYDWIKATWRKRKERLRIESTLSESDYKVDLFKPGIYIFYLQVRMNVPFVCALMR